MQRINWIEWVKAWCMTVVVFCHLPQQEDSFYLQYLSSVILSSFFFVSGYLKKPSTSQKESLKKYFYCLIIPYFIYNAVFYPYWLGKTYIEQGEFPTISECLKGLVRSIPFFFLGNLARYYSYLKETNLKKDFFIGITTLSLSLILFYCHINENHFIIYITLYFIVCFFSVFAVIHLWRCMDNIKSQIVIYISIGTMVIFGLHRILLGIIDFIIERILHISDISYSIPEAIILTIAIELALLPIIIYAKRHCPILLGKNSVSLKGCHSQIHNK